MNEVLAFSMISLVLVLSPGPNSVLILKTVSSKGKRAGIENILGLVVATFVHGAISVFGLSAIILQSAELFMLVKLVGAAYLLYLGLKTVRSALAHQKNSKDLRALEMNPDTSSYKNLLEGFFTQILNPKVSMFYLAAFPQFVDFGSQSYFDAFILVGIHASIIFFWFLSFSLFISEIKLIARNGALGRWVQMLSGGVLVYFSGLLLTQDVG